MFGGFPNAPSVPSPLGISLVAGPSNSQFDMFIPDNSTSGVPVGTKNSVVYESRPRDVNQISGFPSLAKQGADPQPDPTQADTGILTTRDPRAVFAPPNAPLNGIVAHGLPSNFGPGRGRWKRADRRWVSFEVESSPCVPGNANLSADVRYHGAVFTPTPETAGLVAEKQLGDYDFYFRNEGGVNSRNADAEEFSVVEVPDVNPANPPTILPTSGHGLRIKATYEHSTVR